MKKSYLTVTDQFCGAGGSSLGAVAAGAEVKMALNHWKLAIETHSTNFPDTDHDCTDISACDPRRYPSTDILITSPECFPAGTLILAKRGLIPIEKVIEGDEVFTHTGRWKPVTSVMNRRADTILVSGQGHSGLEVTRKHPFWARAQTQVWDNQKRDYNRRVFGEPEWVEADELRYRKYRWATPVFTAAEVLPIPPVPGRGMSLDNPEFWWLVGRWLGDGTIRLRPGLQGGEITIVAGNHEAEDLERRLSIWLPGHNRYRAERDELRWRKRQIRTAYLFECGHQGLCEWLTEHFGKLAHGKTVPAWAFTMPEEWRKALLEGYLSADGSFTIRKTMASSVSKSLAIGIRLLAESLGYRAGLYRYKQHSDTIEGRKLQVRDQWVVAWENNSSSREAFSEDGYSWALVKKIDRGRNRVEVYNLSVEDDESYIADGIVVHNCTNHSLAKGRQRKLQAQLELFGKAQLDPSEERSRATMWDVPRFAEFHNYNTIIVENVIDARHWRLFDAWLHAMRLLDYDFEIVYLNSMFAHPTPQSRDRMYVIFWKRGNKAPNLNFTPPSWCPNCQKNINAVQSWKNPLKKWGRYGVNRQYVYRCPDCTAEVTPYYYCAANAIDWSLPAERIGDRKRPLKEKTLNRIRVGLEKYGRQGLVVQTQYGNEARGDLARGITEPFPTQTTRHSVGLVVDLAYTHGHDGRSYPIDQPWPTQTGQQTLAFIVSMRDAPDYPLKAITDPLPTQSTIGAPYLVELHGRSTAHPVTEPLGCVLTNTHHGLVMPYLVELHGTSEARPVTDPLGCVLAGGNHHGVVMPAPFIVSYYSRDDAQQSLDKPIGTVTTEPRHALVTPQPFLVSYYSGSDQAKPVTDPAATVSTHDRHALVQPEGELKVEDCYFRMLKSHEVGRAMAFPNTYVVLGSERDKVKQFGNAVTPPAMTMLFERCVETFR